MSKHIKWIKPEESIIMSEHWVMCAKGINLETIAPSLQNKMELSETTERLLKVQDLCYMQRTYLFVYRQKQWTQLAIYSIKPTSCNQGSLRIVNSEETWISRCLHLKLTFMFPSNWGKSGTRNLKKWYWSAISAIHIITDYIIHTGRVTVSRDVIVHETNEYSSKETNDKIPIDMNSSAQDKIVAEDDWRRGREWHRE